MTGAPQGPADLRHASSDLRTPAAGGRSGSACAGALAPAVGAQFFYPGVEPKTHWRVLRGIGRGSSGVVFEAQALDQVTAERWPQVALKKVGLRRAEAVQPPPHLYHNTAMSVCIVEDLLHASKM